jgi:hypothetical protein
MDDVATIYDGQVKIAIEHSIRRSVSAQTWNDFIKSGTVEFDFARNDLADLDYVRIRSVGLYLNKAQISGCFGVRIHLPPRAIYKYKGKDGIPLDQSDVPPLVFAAVRNRVNPADVCADDSRAIRNTSPLGTWTANVDLESNAGERVDTVEDVILCLSLQAVPR